MPGELERIITKCLEKERNLRYQHASEIRTDLQRLKRDTDSGRSAAAVVREWHEDSVPAPRRKKPWALALAGIAVICFAVLGYLLTPPMPLPHVSGYVQITNDGRGKGGVLGALVTDGPRLYLGEGSG